MSAPHAKPSILHLTTTIDRGGAENYLVDLIQAQLDAGYRDMHCAYLKGPPYWRDTLTDMGAQVEALESRYYGDPRALWRLRRTLKRLRPDIIHIHGAPAEAYWLAASRFLRQRPRIILTRHEHRRRLFAYPGFGLFDRVISQRADRIIAVSDAVRRTDLSRLPAVADKFVTIHHGIDQDFAVSASARGAIRAEFDVAASAILIGTVAQHIKEKSLDTLLRAYAELRMRLASRHELKLILIGRGPLTAELKQLADELGLADAVIWIPFREDMAAIMSAFDIFVLSSREEGFGIVLIEAMATARPVVACRIDAIPEIVVDEETGLIVPPEDSDAMAVALERLVTDSSLRTRLGERGRERAATEFAISTMQSRTLSVYEDVIAAAPIRQTDTSDTAAKPPSALHN